MQNNKTRIPFKQFLKQYAPLLIIIACILAILAVVIVTTISSNDYAHNNDVVPVQVPHPDEGNINPAEPTDPVNTDDENPTWIEPVKNYTIGMDYSATEFVFCQTKKVYHIHKAVDLKVLPDSEVYAVADGTVESVSTSIMDGTVVVIAHSDGFKSKYSSLKTDPVKVTVGQQIKQGDVIGYASDSAYSEFLEGSHVHFEMFKDDVSIDPNTLIEFKETPTDVEE